MTALLGSIGWGLLVVGAVTHVWHHDRLRTLLALHLDHERWPALGLTAAEVALAVAIAVGYLSDSAVLRWFTIPATALAVGFVLWIARLIITKSELPCACSFSEAPTTPWSLARAACACLVVFFVAADTDATTATSIATLTTGLACAAAIFVVPEAIAWPKTSRALLARVDAYDEPRDPAVRA